MSSQDRILGIADGVIAFDSAGLLPEGYQTKGLLDYVMPDDGLLWRKTSRDLTVTTYIRCAKDGSELWMKSEKNQSHLWACENGEVIFASYSIKMCYLERVDELTGATVEKLPRPFGLNAWSKAYHNDYWWVAHDGNFLKDGKQENRGHTLTKADGLFRISAEIPLPTSSQELFFSPDYMYVYIFFYQNKVMVLDAETFATLNVLEDKSTLAPLAFDANGRLWLRRDRSTVEAWDAVLSKPLSRHRLKGEIMGHHKTEQGVMCVVTWSKKEKILRVYKTAGLQSPHPGFDEQVDKAFEYCNGTVYFTDHTIKTTASGGSTKQDGKFTYWNVSPDIPYFRVLTGVGSGEEEFRHYSISYGWNIINESDKTNEGLTYLTIELLNVDSMTIGERRVMDGGRFIEYGTHE